MNWPSSAADLLRPQNKIIQNKDWKANLVTVAEQVFNCLWFLFELAEKYHNNWASFSRLTPFLNLTMNKVDIDQP